MHPAIRSVLALTLLTAACGGSQAAPQEPTPAQKKEETVHTNRLALESSPYLLQHQHNPVDWYPWGDEAFEKARKEDKPIFLSIGYSTCHWCHVMERESFENEDIAKLMNEWFVCVKVDREERPDVDAVYMTAVQAMSGGRGGWPLSAFLDHDRKPFFGGTYFPPEDRFGRPGFTTVLGRIHELWTTQRSEVRRGAEQLLAHIESRAGAQGGVELDAGTLARAVDQYGAAFDAQHGGFGNAPKFPRSFSFSFLLRQARRDRKDAIGGWIASTLEFIRRGGIHDQIGGGFHRYSTDREWLVPHFEKMLYDRAFLARAYLEAYQATGNEKHAEVARGIFEYVLRDLRDPAGGFHSAEDADSEGVEGKFYVWNRAEILAALGEPDGELFARVYACTEEGNFLDEATHAKNGQNILHLTSAISEHAGRLGVTTEALKARLATLRGKLLAVRAKRVRPHLDDKVLTDWNGMMISAFALGGAVLDEPRYLAAADEAADFVLATLRTDDGLLHRYRDGQAGIPAFLDDYAYLAQGLLDLYQAKFDIERLRAAKSLAHAMVTRFTDPEDGGFHLASNATESLVLRTKDLYDGAIPSGNSAAANLLVRLGRITQDAVLEKAGRDTLAAWSGTISQYPMGYPMSLNALDFVLGPSQEIVIAGDPADAATQALIATVRAHHAPNVVVVLHPPGDAGAAVRETIPFVAGQGLVDGKPAAYVCSNYACKAPVTTPDELRELLGD